MMKWLTNLNLLRNSPLFCRHKHLSNELLRQAELERAEEELKILRDDFFAAAKFFHQNYSKHDVLPLYLVIGEPTFGKTTLLASSNMELKDIHGDKIHSDFSTKYCVWLFSARAVFLDTAGVYTKSDKENPHANLVWLGFLNLLRDSFVHNPLSGVIVVIDICTLIGPSPNLHNVLNDVKERLYEIAHYVGKLPIFITFTKFDLIVGFDEFFADLSVEERQQLCGITFANNENSNNGNVANGDKQDGEQNTYYVNPQTTFATSFATLLRSLQARMLRRLHQEISSDSAVRENISNFFIQFSNLHEALATVIDEIPCSNGHIELRGLYFVSAVQNVGNSKNYLQLELLRTLQIPLENAHKLTHNNNDIRNDIRNDSDNNTPYFIHNLFTQELLPSQKKPKKTLKFTKSQLILIAILALALSVANILWYKGYKKNVAILSDVINILQNNTLSPTSTTAATATNTIATTVQQLPLQDRIARLETTIAYLDEKEKLGDSYYGLNYTNKLATLLSENYYAKIAPDFVTRLQKTLEAELTMTDAMDYKYLYDTLKTYIMLSNVKRFDPVFVRKWFIKYWQEKIRLDTDKTQRLVTRLDIISHKEISIIPSEQIIATAREILSSHHIPKEDFVYAKLENIYSKQQQLLFQFGEKTSDKNKDKEQDLQGKDNERIKKIHISKLYTADNFEKVYNKQIPEIAYALSHSGGDWVLTDPNANSANSVGLGQMVIPRDELNKLVDALRTLYIKRYVEVWNNAARQIKVPNVDDLKKMEKFLANISNSNYPLLSFIKIMQANLALHNPPPEFIQAVEAKLPDWYTIDIKAIYVALEHLASDFSKIASSSDVNKAAFTKAAKRFQTIDNNGDNSSIDNANNKEMHNDATHKDTLSNLYQLAINQPSPVREWLQNIADNSWLILLAGAKNHINNMWTSNVLSEYRRLIENNYPFFKDASTSVSIQDLTKIFSTNGIIDRFFNNYLRPFVDTEQVYWIWKNLNGQHLNISQEHLEIFIRAALIKKMFYTNNNDKPIVKFSLTPQAVTPTTQQVVLNIGGQMATHLKGQRVTDSFVWPGNDPEVVTVEFTNNQGKTFYSTMPQEPWAWFRLLDKTNFRAIDKTQRFSFTIDLNGNAAQYEMDVEQPINPFIPEIINHFRCPEAL